LLLLKRSSTVTRTLMNLKLLPSPNIKLAKRISDKGVLLGQSMLAVNQVGLRNIFMKMKARKRGVNAENLARVERLFMSKGIPALLVATADDEAHPVDIAKPLMFVSTPATSPRSHSPSPSPSPSRETSHMRSASKNDVASLSLDTPPPLSALPLSFTALRSKSGRSLARPALQMSVASGDGPDSVALSALMSLAA